jgi:hypothetical protein
MLPSTWRGSKHTGETRHFRANGEIIKYSPSFFPGLLDGIKGRFSDASTKDSLLDKLKEFAADGMSDHRLPTGYLPRLSHAIDAELHKGTP